MIEPIRQTLHQLRVLKSASEAQLMRKSCQIGAAALRRTIAASPELRTELDLLATVDYESKIQEQYNKYIHLLLCLMFLSCNCNF